MDTLKLKAQIESSERRLKELEGENRQLKRERVLLEAELWCETIKAAWREAVPGGCRMLSKGHDCDCPLCCADNLYRMVLEREDKRAELQLELEQARRDLENT